MTAIEKFDRTEMDAWPIEQAGLSKRVTKCCLREGIETVGELREIPEDDLLQWRNLGWGSVREIESYFNLCESLENGESRFLNIPEVINRFVKSEGFDILVGRYGLDRKSAEPTRNYYTLQVLGNSRQLSRERVRQIEAESLSKLSANIVLAFLKPFLQEIGEIISKRGGIVGCHALFNRGDKMFGGLNPCALTLLLVDIHGSGIGYQRNVFTTLSTAEVEDCYNRLLEKLEAARKPIEMEKISEGFETEDAQDMLSALKHLLFTAEGRLIYSVPSFEYYLLGNISEKYKVIHYTRIMQIANRGLAPESRRGEGFYLKRLGQAKAFERLGFGRYAVKREQ